MDREEIRDLGAAWLILGIAFANLLGGLKPTVIIYSLLTAGVGFLLHELAHKVVAQHFDLPARFEANYQMLGFALLASFAGFIFAAPGAVMTSGYRSEKKQMLISVAGPVTNILLAAVFLVIPGPIGSYGLEINAWLALFNMIPVGGLDGQSVWKYSKPVFGAVVLVSAVMVFLL